VFSTAGAGVKTNLLFFTKGKKTERIWYYDLSHVKMGKKTPMTLAHFGWGVNGEVLADAELPTSLSDAWRAQAENEGKPYPSYARLLPLRGTATAESDCSWTIDFSGRRAKARDDMAPHLAEVEKLRAEVVALKDKIAARKKLGAKDDVILPLRDAVAQAEKAARDAQAKADAIDAAVYDLKAVNPRARVVRDSRTPEEVLGAIAAHGRAVDAALTRLRALMDAG
jgi:type I restriction enzyme M protein